jgi:excisionase family DNA binding protein
MARKNNNDNGDSLGFPPLLTVPETAQAARCSRRFIENKIRSGELCAIRAGRKFTRIRGRDLAAFLNRHATI